MTEHYPPGRPDPYGGPPQGQQPPPPPPQQPAAGPPNPYGTPPPAAPEPPADRGDGGGGVFKALFDFSFTNYATPSIVRIIYVLAIVFGTLAWLVAAVTMLASGRGTVMLVLVIALGWIPLLLWISILRVGLELALASVRTAENTRRLREGQGL